LFWQLSFLFFENVDEAVGAYSIPLLFEAEAANSSLSIVERREEHSFPFSIDSHRAFKVPQGILILLFILICSNISWVLKSMVLAGFGKREEEKSLTISRQINTSPLVYT
jgi:hypothetical protein